MRRRIRRPTFFSSKCCNFVTGDFARAACIVENVTRAQLHALERILRELHDDGITNPLWRKHDESSARFPEHPDTNTMLNHDRYRMTFAGHGDSRTTKVYDRHGQKLLLEDMER